MGLFLSEVNKDIKKELKNRMDLKRRGMKPDDKSGIYFRSTWMRMWSTSDKKTLLSGGMLGPDARAGSGVSYKNKSGFDNIYSPKSDDTEKDSYRPMPGITNMSANYKGEYGSTRECKIKWICWSFHELEELQKLFLTHGKTVVVEWGWSTGDKSQTSVGLDPNKICDIYKDSGVVRQKVLESKGNYDAMIGLVTNWNWNLRDDGGIECTTTIVAMGTNGLEKELKPTEDQEDDDKEQMVEYVQNLGHHLKRLCTKNKTWTGEDGAAAQYITESDAWVSWGFIEDMIVTQHLAMKTKGGVMLPVMKSMKYKDDGSEDGLSLIYAPAALKTIKGDLLDVEASAPFSPFKKEKNHGAPLRHLAIHIKVVKAAFTTNPTTLQDALTNLFKELNMAACDIWDFRIVQHEERPGQFGVIDANWGENRVKSMHKKAFIFPTWNRDSIVRSQELTADLPDSMAMSVMYGANKPKASNAPSDHPDAEAAAQKLAEDTPDDCCLNQPEGMVDAANKKVNEKVAADEKKKAAQEKAQQKATEGDQTKDETVEKTKTPEEAGKICSKVTKEKFKDVDLIYPVTLELTIDGISGISWGNAVHTAFISKQYKDNVVFQVTSVNHTLDNSDWVTTIQTVCRIAGKG